jgi:hypothetical protein
MRYEKPQISDPTPACAVVQNSTQKVPASVSDAHPNMRTIPAYEADE